ASLSSASAAAIFFHVSLSPPTISSIALGSFALVVHVCPVTLHVSSACYRCRLRFVFEWVFGSRNLRCPRGGSTPIHFSISFSSSVLSSFSSSSRCCFPLLPPPPLHHLLAL